MFSLLLLTLSLTITSGASRGVDSADLAAVGSSRAASTCVYFYGFARPSLVWYFSEVRRVSYEEDAYWAKDEALKTAQTRWRNSVMRQFNEDPMNGTGYQSDEDCTSLETKRLQSIESARTFNRLTVRVW